MKEQKVKLKKGNVLVSQPFMVEGSFRRSVIYLAEYNKEGALGFIINRQLDSKVDELLGGFPEFDDFAYFGGPVATDTLHYIHKIGNLLEDSVEIKDGVFWGGDFEKLKILISTELVSPSDIKFYVGYTGWSPGQLEDELVHGSWIVANGDPNYVFGNMKEEELWSKVLEYMGDNYEVIAQIPETFFPN